MSGGELLAVGNACPFNKLGYTGCETDTYYGEALAVVKANGDNFTVTAGDGRWYSGAGIYRPVNMYVGDKKRITLNGVKIKTLSLYPAVVEVTVNVTGVGDIAVSV